MTQTILKNLLDNKNILSMKTLQMRTIAATAVMICLAVMQPMTAGASATADDDATARLNSHVENIDVFNRLFPQEKAYLHFDNTGYFRGETMWFSAYVVRTDNRRLTDMSKLLYVELLDPTGEVIETCKVRLDGGRGDGSIKLDKLLTSGFYEVRAYTRYMLNWDAAWTFSRVFPVFESPSKDGDYSNPVIADPDYRKRLPNMRQTDTVSVENLNVVFYPEGGRLVCGLTSRVAFAVTDKSGRPLDTKGTLRTADGTTVPVKTMREGRGVFTHTPSAVPAVLVLADEKGKNREFTLPEADAEGCVMSVNTTGDEYIDVEITRTATCTGPLALTLVNGGNVEATDIIQTDSTTVSRRFAKADMADGVSQLALIRPDGSIVAERMVFVYPHKGADTIAITAEGSLDPYGRMVLTTRTRPGAVFSMAVRDASSDVNGTSGNAATWLLLSSDLRGYIHKPEYYLEADDAEHRRAADLLMMVQGWRRYNIGQMDGTEIFARRHPIEDGLYLYGQLREVKKKHTVDDVDLRATLFNRMGESMSGHTVTDSAGYYAFRLPDCEGEWTLLLNTEKGGEAEKYRIGIDRNVSPEARTLSPMEKERTDTYADSLDVVRMELPDTIIRTKPRLSDLVHMLKEVKVRGKRIFENSRAVWENEQRGAYKAYIRYDCDKAADEIYDKGLETPGILEWLSMKNDMFDGSTADMDDLGKDMQETNYDDINKIPISLVTGATTTARATDYQGEYTQTSFGHVLNLQRTGLSYKNRPIIWILNNNFYCISMSPASISTDDITYVYNSSTERMPVFLDECKSVYISEDDEIWKHYVEINGMESYSPVTVFVYSHRSMPIKQKGLRRTYFEGYSPVETFQMPDYSLIPEMEDHRRTLYWNPAVKAGKDGTAKINIYNNSSCRQLSVSAEGITDGGQPMVYRR